MEIRLIWMDRSMPMTADAQRSSFPTKNIRDGVGGGLGHALAFTLSDRQLVEVDLLNFDAIFPEGDELQERRAILLFVSVRSANSSLDVFRSRSPGQDPEGLCVW